MQLLQTALTALFSIAVLFALTKLIGCRQVSQLSVFDYINGITIGSIAAELSTAEGMDFWRWLVALVVYGLVTVLLSVVTDKSITLRGFFSGKPMILFQNGTLLSDNFKKCRLDVSEFLTQCRENGWFDLASLDTVVMEPNGSLSFLPRETQRPVTPADLGQSPTQTTLPLSVVEDGQVLERNLRDTGHDLQWLRSQLTGLGVAQEQVFWACIGQEGQLQVYPRGGKSHGTRKR